MQLEEEIGPFRLVLIYPYKNVFLSRLYGSYEALKGGNVADALIDFTGGICEGYTLRGVNSNVPRNIVNILFKALDRQSLIGCGINVSLDKTPLVDLMYRYKVHLTQSQ